MEIVLVIGCNGLNMKCPPQTHVEGLSPAGGLIVGEGELWEVGPSWRKQVTGSCL
jgi:hypothetical protein